MNAITPVAMLGHRSVDMIENHTFDEISVDDSACLTGTLMAEDIQLFATMSGDVNPAHLDEEYAKGTQFRGIIAHRMGGGALIASVLGTDYPGPVARIASCALALLVVKLRAAARPEA